MPSPTVYPFRQTLTLCLRQLILSVAVPAINVDLTAQMTAQGVLPIPQFGDSSVVLGDLSPVSQATMCLLDSGEENIRIGSEGLFYTTLRTQVQVKTPAVGDNAPEDFSLLGSIVTDTLRDLFTSQANAVLIPKTLGGANLLPSGMSFQDCYFLGARSLNFPQREVDTVTYTRGWVITHTASICYFQNRPNPLGT